MSIRVISGSAKGKKLKLVPGDSTRPIMDRVKESLFNIIGQDILDCNILDLFAGTGSVAIEALSRGATSALLLDIDTQAIRTIQENLRLTHFEERAQVRRQDAFALLRTQPEAAFDFIYIAPPQYKNMWRTALEALDQNPAWVAADGTIIVQIDPTEQHQMPLTHFTLTDERRYGNTLLYFYQRTATQLQNESTHMIETSHAQLEKIVHELMTLYQVSAPPVPIEKMLQEPLAGLWREYNIMDISIGFLTTKSLFGPRMSLARFLVRVISTSDWGIAQGLRPMSDSSLHYHPFARMLVMPATMIAELRQDARTPQLMSVHFEVPEDEATKRLDELAAYGV